jgi:DNA-binding transcriptional MerR regulator
MLPPARSLDLAQLCDAADVTPRTVRYYIQQGLLPAPETRGPGPHYHDGHVARLRLIRRLQQEHLPLGEIRQRLERLTDNDVDGLLRAAPAKTRETPALSYIRGVLAGEGPRALSAAAVKLSESPATFQDVVRTQTTRSTWERISLTPDIELHIRRPLARRESRLVDRLLELARDFTREEPQ